MSKRYRYILCGIVNESDPISNFRLIGSTNIGTASSAIRVELPDDLQLEKWDCDPYSTTTDSRTLQQLGYDVMIRINGKWKIRNDLKSIQPHTYHEILRSQGLYRAGDIGYLEKDDYKQYMQNISDQYEKEWQIAYDTKESIDNSLLSASDVDCLSKSQILKILDLYIRERRKNTNTKDKTESQSNNLYWVSAIVNDKAPWLLACNSGVISLEKAMEVVDSIKKTRLVMSIWIDKFDENNNKTTVFHECLM